MEYSFDILSHLPRWNWMGILLVAQIAHVLLATAHMIYKLFRRAPAVRVEQPQQIIVHVPVPTPAVATGGNSCTPTLVPSISPSRITCRHCGKRGLNWRSVGGQWILHEGSVRHSCLKEQP